LEGVGFVEEQCFKFGELAMEWKLGQTAMVFGIGEEDRIC